MTITKDTLYFGIIKVYSGFVLYLVIVQVNETFTFPLIQWNVWMKKAIELSKAGGGYPGCVIDAVQSDQRGWNRRY